MDDICTKLWNRAVRTEKSCLEWQGTRQSDGYGMVWHKGRMRLVHRVAFEEMVGPPTDQINHKCDNRICFEPMHLYCGTQKDNMRDRDEHGHNGSAKVSRATVAEIRGRYIRGQRPTMQMLADEYGLSVAQISRIVNGTRWR